MSSHFAKLIGTPTLIQESRDSGLQMQSHGEPRSLPTSANHPTAQIEANPKVRLRHIPELDGIRGIAVLMVLACHIFVVDASRCSPAWAAFCHLMSTGGLGVDLFFVLSGFLITRILLETRSNSNYFVNFYARRTLRIFPLYFGVLIIALICNALDHNQIFLWTYTTNFKIAADRSWVTFSNTNAVAFGYFWSLAIEEHFYLIWPFVVYIAPPRLLIKIALGASLLCLLCRTAYVFRTGQTLPAHVLTQFRVDTLLLGSVAGALTISNPFSERTSKRAAISILWLTTTAVACLYLHDGLRDNMRMVAGPGSTLTAIWFSSIIFCLVKIDTPLNWLLRRRVLRLFGKYSYCIYISQGFVISRLSWYLLQFMTRFEAPSQTSVIVAKLVSVPGCVLVAWISWHLYEKQFTKLKYIFR